MAQAVQRFMTANQKHPPKVLAVSSGGGHWTELQRLRPAWEGAHVDFVVTDASYRAGVAETAAASGRPAPRVCVVPDANARQKLRLMRLALGMLWVVMRLRPDVVISTGAAPGYFAIRFGKLFGARTVWVDSIANAAEMSLSGKLAQRHCDLWLTQWPHIATATGAVCAGAVM